MPEQQKQFLVLSPTQDNQARVSNPHTTVDAKNAQRISSSRMPRQENAMPPAQFRNEVENWGIEDVRNLGDLGAYFSKDELEKVCSEHGCSRGTAILIAAREYIENEETRKAGLSYRVKEESAMESAEEVTKLSKSEPSLGGPEPTYEAPSDDDEVGTDSEYEYYYPEEGCMVGGEAVVDGEDVFSLG